MKLIFIHLIALVASISGNNRANRVVSLQQIQNRCLTHQNTAPKDKSCTTQLGVKMQMANVEDGVFFCLSYKKSPGDAYNAFDIIRINLHPDYDLQYGGANVIDYEMPTFKIYQGPEYNSRFALFSNNSDFRIYEVTINEVPQSCSFGKRGNRMWPHGNKTQVSEPENEGNGNDQIEANQFQPPSMPTFPERRETSTVNLVEDRREPTTIKPARHSPNTLPSQSNDAKNPSCGMVQKTIDLTQFSMPSNPGQFPFVASIHQVIDGDENNSVFKCSGSIIDQSVIITSVNCLMDSGARLLSENEIQVHVGQYSKNAKSPPSKIYEVEKIMPHEQFNFKLDNNVAALKLKRKIEFDDFIQPVCMPDKNTNIAEGANGKLAGYDRNSGLMTEADFMTSFEDEEDDILNDESKNPASCMTFNGNNTSENINSTNLGGGLFMSNPSSPNQFIIIGIVSRLPHASSDDCNAVFTNMIFFIDWVHNCLATLVKSP